MSSAIGNGRPAEGAAPLAASPAAEPADRGDEITLLLADDHTIFRQGLKRLLAENPRFRVVAEACDGREALELARATSPRVILMDITMPGLSGLEATRRVRKANPESQVLMLSVHSDEEYIARAFEAGALGYAVKDIRAPELFEAIEATAQGRRYLSPNIADTIVSEYLRLRKDRAEAESPFHVLTVREREILRLLTEGKSSKEIATELAVSPKTVETHRANIMRKLDIHNIADLVRYAIARGIVEI
jgi:two-component system response regulator NreC